VDYLAEILRSLRNHDYSDRYQNYFTLSSDISTRDRDGINKTFSGMMKILFPHGEAPAEEIEEILKLAVEGRKRVKDQLMRLDSTYSKVCFTYANNLGQTRSVTTLEEEEYPDYYHKTVVEESEAQNLFEVGDAASTPGSNLAASDPGFSSLKEQHLIYQENQRGISFDTLFGPYFKSAAQVTITDPYIRLFYQIRNLMELLETIVKYKLREDEVSVHLITVEDDFKGAQQQEFLENIKESSRSIGINFTWEFDVSGSLHARHIVTDHGWKILLDRGLDIFQHYEMNDAFTFANRLQQVRPCKAFEVTFLRSDTQKSNT